MPREKSQTKADFNPMALPHASFLGRAVPAQYFADISLLLLLGGPTLPHKAEQVLDGLFVAAIFLYGKLLRPFIELGGHFNGFIGWATQRYQGFG